MNLKDYYYYFKSVIPEKECKKIINLGLSKKNNFARIGDFKDKKNLSKKEKNLIKQKRNSKVTWLDDKWIYELILPYVQLANKNAGWNFQIDWAENCQFTQYKKNQYYHWHCDSFLDPFNDPTNLNFHNKIRKLSVTVSLSDPKTYKGGELEFDFRNSSDGKPVIRKCEEILPMGSLVVFPSHVWHRVNPVTKGTRYSLVIWNIGYPFK